jgi:hypothetical protein
MNISFQGWIHAIGATLNATDDTATQVLSYRYERPILMQAVVVLATINLMLIAIVSYIAPAPVEVAIQVSPVSLTILIAASMVTLAFGLSRAGRIFGGTADFDASLTVVIWLQAVGLTFDLGQIALMGLSPTLAALFGIGSLVALLWCTVKFVKVLHGFSSPAHAWGTLIIAMIGTIFAVVVLMALLGITPSGDMT